MLDRRPLAALLIAASPWAQALPTQTGSEAPSPARQVTAVSPSGSALALDGALATVFYSNGSSRSALFSASTVGIDAGASASDGHFLISAESGLTASFPAFSITNTDDGLTLVGFRIDGLGTGGGQMAFDRGFSGAEGTAGSNTGIDLTLDFTGRTFLTGTVDVTYSNPIGLGGAAPVGDLFGTVEVRMNLATVVGLPPPSSFGGAFSSIRFNTDIDTVVHASPVPEPASAALLLLGAAALAARRRVGSMAA